MVRYASFGESEEEMKVSIVIPNWNGKELLEKNLPAVLEAAANPKNSILEVIVVDDKSTDDSVEFLEKNYKEQVRIVRHTKNRGFPSSVNTGTRTARGTIVCLLNTDVIPQKNFLEKAEKHFEDSNVFAVSLHERGYGPSVGKFEFGFIGFGPGKETDKFQNTFWVSGGSGLFRRSVWMRLKGFDEVLLSPYYWEDVDICYRAAKRGYKLLWEPTAIVEHKHESTMKKLNQKKVSKIKERNQLVFIWKNLTSANMFRKHIRGLLRRTLKNPGYIRIVFLALSKLPKIISARKKEKKEGRVSDEAIFARFS